MQMAIKRNLVLYMDDELVAKSKELGLNLSKTFENHLKQLINNFQSVYPQNNNNLEILGSPGEIRTPVRGSKGLHDCPLHYRAKHHVL